MSRARRARWSSAIAAGSAALVCAAAGPALADGYKTRGPLNYGDGVFWTANVNVHSDLIYVDGGATNAIGTSGAAWSAANFALYQCAGSGGSCSIIAQVATSDTFSTGETHNALSHGHTYESCLSVHPNASGDSYFAVPNSNTLCSPYSAYA